MEVYHPGRKEEMKIFLLGVLVFCFGITAAEGKARLFLVTMRPNIAAGKHISLDVYLYNEGSKATKLPALKYLSAEWLLDDTTGKRLGRAGGSETITDHGSPNVLVPAGAMLHRKIKLDVKAEAGDIVNMKVRLGEGRGLESNAVVVYCPAEKRH